MFGKLEKYKPVPKNSKAINIKVKIDAGDAVVQIQKLKNELLDLKATIKDVNFLLDGIHGKKDGAVE